MSTKLRAHHTDMHGYWVRTRLMPEVDDEMPPAFWQQMEQLLKRSI